MGKHTAGELYTEFVRNTDATANSDPELRMLHYISGLSTEVGEVSQAVQKAAYKKKGLPPMSANPQILDELGDVMWYATALAFYCGSSLEEVLEMNMKKIKERQQK